MGEIKKSTKGKLKPNIIDFLIVILLLGALIGIMMRMDVVEKITLNGSAEPARISFMVQNISSSSYDCFENGTEFYSKTHGCYVGKLESAGAMPAEKLIPSIDGSMVSTVSPAMDENDPNSESYRVDVRGNLIGSGIFSEEGFLLNGTTYIAPGSEFTMESRNITFTVLITDIQAMNSAE